MTKPFAGSGLGNPGATKIGSWKAESCTPPPYVKRQRFRVSGQTSNVCSGLRVSCVLTIASEEYGFRCSANQIFEVMVQVEKNDLLQKFWPKSMYTIAFNASCRYLVREVGLPAELNDDVHTTGLRHVASS